MTEESAMIIRIGQSHAAIRPDEPVNCEILLGAALCEFWRCLTDRNQEFRLASQQRNHNHEHGDDDDDDDHHHHHHRRRHDHRRTDRD